MDEQNTVVTNPEPQVQPSVSAIPPLGNQMPSMALTPIPSSKKSLKIALIIISGLLLIGGGSAAAYFGIIVPNKPENILKNTITNTLQSDKTGSFAFDGDLQVSGSTVPAQFKGLAFNGSIDKGNALNMFFSPDLGTLKPTFDIKSVDGKSFFIKLGSLGGVQEAVKSLGGPSLAEVPGALSIIQKVSDKWFEIDESTISSIMSKAKTTNTLSAGKLSKEDRKKVADIYATHQFMKIKEDKGSEDINGKKSNHYVVNIDKTEVKGFVSAFKALNLKGMEIKDSEVKQFNDQVDKLSTEKYPIELWVDASAKLPTQVKFVSEQNGNKMSVRLAIKGWGESVKVDKPADAKSLLQLVGEIAPEIQKITGSLKGNN